MNEKNPNNCCVLVIIFWHQSSWLSLEPQLWWSSIRKQRDRSTTNAYHSEFYHHCLLPTRCCCWSAAGKFYLTFNQSKKKKKSLDITVLTACSNATLHPSPVGVMPYWGHVTILLCAVNVICWEFSHSSSFTWQALLFIFCSGLQRPAVTLMTVFKNSDLSLRKENINHVCPKSGSRTNTAHPVIFLFLLA